MTVCFVLAVALAAPNVVFLSVDTLRADRLGCYGYPCPTSPNIDRLAKDALVFDDCVCEVPLTAPSFGSMFSSRYPRLTGMTRNGLRLPANVPTITEQFRMAGYQTFCVQSNWTLKAHLSGLDRGFDVYEDDFHHKRWGLIKPERYANEITDIALALLAKRDTSKPFFCWIHYSDPHAPYRHHRGFTPSAKTGALSGRRAGVNARYDSEVAFADHHIGRLLEGIPRENTFIVFAADHGESLFEHDYLGHGRRIYQEGLHIPLLMAGPGISAGRSQTQARGVDIGPTLLAMAGIPRVPEMLGLDLLDPSTPQARERVIETYGGAVLKLPGIKALMAERPPQKQGVLRQGWKLILDNDGGQELFYLPQDPGEIHNRAASESELTASLRKAIDEWNARYPRHGFEAAGMSRDDEDALRSLGYIE